MDWCIELRRWRWWSLHASSGPPRDILKYSRVLGAEQAGPSGPPALDESVSLPLMKRGEGGALGSAVGSAT